MGEAIFLILFFGAIVLFIVKLINLYKGLSPEDKQEALQGFIEGLTKSKGNRSYREDTGGNYVIQYRSGSSWIDGPGSNDEFVAESMFDQFLSNDPRANRRCRLVKKRNGRVVSVLSTN